MKVSCLPVSYFQAIQNGEMPLEDWLNQAKQCGLDGLDLSTLLIRNHTPMYTEWLKKELQKAGLPLVMVTAYPDFTHPDALQREREEIYFMRDMALASELGAKYIRITPGQAHPGVSIQEGIRLAVEHFKRVWETTRKYNIKLLYENHSKPGSWKYPDFSQPTEIFLKIVEGIRDTDIGINFDTANTIVYGDEALPVLTEVIDKIETVHAADTSIKGALMPTVIGEGIVPFERIFDRLKKSGWDGWVCIEEASGTGVSGVIKAIEFVRGTWASV